MIVLTIRSDAYISRSGDFHADNNDNDRRANGLLYPFVHAHGVKCFFTVPCQCGQGLVHLYIKFNTMTISKCALFKYDVVLYVHVYNESIYVSSKLLFLPCTHNMHVQGEIVGFAVFPPVYLKWGGPPYLILNVK